eukprot:TRINITY_DN7323_c0_g2_i1.p1 TRINITY_DN7323_c0_g2~~TRINITY_DN7323_c0_g2_i1.p1  ORF type:complete len:377 (+),score=88.33 TRINITY_DN7323_c0_g2_i1:118-1248(+)
MLYGGVELQGGYRYDLRRPASGGSPVLTRAPIYNQAVDPDSDDSSDEDDDCAILDGSAAEIVVGCSDYRRHLDDSQESDSEPPLEESEAVAVDIVRQELPGQESSSTPPGSSQEEARESAGQLELREKLLELERALMTAQEAHAADREKLLRRNQDLEASLAACQEALAHRSWPALRVFDVDEADQQARHIQLQCPGVDEDAIDISGIPNGVHVRIDGSKALDENGQPQPVFEKEFHYDHRVDGCFELRMDECSLDLGVLRLVLRRAAPQPMKLRRSPGKDSSMLSGLDTSSESLISGEGLPDAASVATPLRRRPEYYRMTPAQTKDDASSATSEVPSSMWRRPPGQRPAAQAFVVTQPDFPGPGRQAKALQYPRA